MSRGAESDAVGQKAALQERAGKREWQCMNRRHFLSTSVAAGVALQTGRSLAQDAVSANPYKGDIGLQAYTLRNELSKDAAGTMKAVAEAGFKHVELFGFPGIDDMIKAAKDAGLKIHSTHFQADSIIRLKGDDFSGFMPIVEKAKNIGLSHLVVPYIDGNDRKTLDDWKRLAENFNKAAEKTREAGIQLCYHNHNFEFQPKEGGKSGFDIFIAEFSPAMKFELDLFWVKVGGHEPAELISQLSGRVEQLHLKDVKPGTKTPSYSGVGEDDFKEVGAGILPWKEILAAAKKAGVKYCHVEQDQSKDPLASIRQSIAYLEKM